jgi:hypothetical protein
MGRYAAHTLRPIAPVRSDGLNAMNATARPPKPISNGTTLSRGGRRDVRVRTLQKQMDA